MSRPASALGRRVGHLLAELGEPEAGQPAVEDMVGVVHLAVAEQVHDGRASRRGRRPLAGGRGAGGVRQRRRRCARSASSSWLAPTNHASYADGGR